MPVRRRGKGASSTRKVASRVHVLRHRDGSVWARGRMAGKLMTGLWRWYRKDGSIMRSGAFKVGRQVGTWTTYDATGRVVRVTTFGPKTKKK